MKILIIASDKGGHFAPFVEEQIVALQSFGVQVVSYAIMRKGFMGYLRELPALKQMIRAEQPDVLHAHFGLTGLMAAIAVLGLNTPIVVTYHGCDINDTKIRPFSKIAMYLSSWNIFVSRRQMINAFGSENKASRNKKWSIISCGVNIAECDSRYVNEEWFTNKFPQMKYVLFAGSFESIVKNPSLAKQAVEIYNQNHPDCPIELLELRGYSRAEVVTLMHKCKTLLLTSIREGSPQVVKEAMACGCPIVSVDVGDVAERTNGLEGCYVVPTRNPQEIAKVLEESISFGKTSGREKLIEEGLDNVQIAERLINIYNKIIK